MNTAPILDTPTGVRLKFHDFDDDKVLITSTQEVDAILRKTKKMRGEAPERRTHDRSDTMHLGSIPMSIYNKATIETSSAEERNAYLMNWLRQNPYFKETNKRI